MSSSRAGCRLQKALEEPLAADFPRTNGYRHARRTECPLAISFYSVRFPYDPNRYAINSLIYGGTAGARTRDQSLKRALLYQLSYRPVCRGAIIAELPPRNTANGLAVACGIRKIYRRKAGGAQAAGIAFCAGSSLTIGLVARHSHAEIHAQTDAGADYFGLGHVEQRCLDFEARAFHARFGRQLRQTFESFYECRAAVRISGVINGIDAHEDILGMEHLGPPERQREQQRIAGRHIGDGYAAGGRFGHWNRRIGQCRASDPAEFDSHSPMFASTKGRSHVPGRIEFRPMTLAVRDAERIALIFARSRHCQDGGRIQAARQEHDRAPGRTHHLPGMSPHRTL